MQKMIMVTDDEQFITKLKELTSKAADDAVQRALRNVEAFNNTDRLINRKEAAKALGIGIAHLDNLVREEKLRKIKIGGSVRFSLKQIIDLMENGVEF